MRVICISGKAQHGKDTTANILKEILEVDCYKVLITHFADLVKYVCRQFFGWNGIKDEKGRGILQRVGTDIVRTQIPTFWVDFICSILKLFPNEWDYILIPDCRFENECEVFIKNGFDTKLLRIERPNFDNGLTPEQKQHPSETSLDNYKYDCIITNDDTLDDLKEKANQFLNDLINRGIE